MTELVPPAVVEVAADVYAYVDPVGGWFANNAGFVVGADAVACIDTCATTARTKGLLEAIRRTTSAPVRFLINTHHHGDHTNGNFLLEDATIIGHRATREAIERWAVPPDASHWTPVEVGDIRMAPPVVTFEDGIRLVVADMRLHVMHVGVPAHTDNDTIVWIPSRSVLFAGDLIFGGGTPFLLHGSLAGSRQALDLLEALRPSVVVPGHGPPGGVELIRETRDYLDFVESTAREGRRMGLKPLELARRTELGRFGGLVDPERIVGNLHRAYAELDGEVLGSRLSSRAVMDEMVAYTGGLLRARA